MPSTEEAEMDFIFRSVSLSPSLLSSTQISPALLLLTSVFLLSGKCLRICLYFFFIAPQCFFLFYYGNIGSTIIAQEGLKLKWNLRLSYHA